MTTLPTEKPEIRSVLRPPRIAWMLPVGAPLAIALAWALVYVVVGRGPGPEESLAAPDARVERDRTPGHHRMLAALEEIKRRTPRENAYLGEVALDEARAELKGLADGAADQDRWSVLSRLAAQELRIGNERRAIECYEEAYDLLPKLGDELTREQRYETVFRLGVAYLRFGETQNCTDRHSPESCILPIRGAGIHTVEGGSRQAIRYFQEVAEHMPPSSPLYFKAVWLLNVAYMTLGGYPGEVPEPYRVSPAVFDSNQNFPRFENIAPRLGLSTFNLSGGAALDDFTGNGYLDIATTTYDPSGQMRFFRNDGDGTFSDRTGEAGLLGLYGGLNVVQADYDNDGALDLYVLRGAWLVEAGRHPNSLLRNDGSGTFTDVTFEAGLGNAHYPTQTAAWADYDNDGDVDLYVGNEHGNFPAPGGVSPGLEAPCQLFRNNGDGTFTDVAAAAGVANRSYVKGVVWGDYNGDRFPDLYVSTFRGPNRLYRSNGDGTFTDVAEALGVSGPISSFPIWFWDFDNDGVLDLYVSSYPGHLDVVARSWLGEPVPAAMLPRLYRGDGRGGFQDVAAEHNLTRVNLPMGANFGDLDNDGYLDFYLGTGYPDYEALMPNVLYHNRNGRGFFDVTYAAGLGHLQKGHAVAFGDVDHDGDQDIFEQMGGAYPDDRFGDALFENPGFANHWIAVHLVGTRSNRAAIGARIRVDLVEEGAQRSVYKHVTSGGSFGANPLRQTIGLGRASRVEALEVYWPTTDLTQTFYDVAMNALVRIVEGEDQLVRINL